MDISTFVLVIVACWFILGILVYWWACFTDEQFHPEDGRNIVAILLWPIVFIVFVLPDIFRFLAELVLSFFNPIFKIGNIISKKRWKK